MHKFPCAIFFQKMAIVRRNMKQTEQVQSTSNILRIVCAFVGKHKRFEYLNTYPISNINVLVCPAANIYLSLSAELTLFLFPFLFSKILSSLHFSPWSPCIYTSLL